MLLFPRGGAGAGAWEGGEININKEPRQEVIYLVILLVQTTLAADIQRRKKPEYSRSMRKLWELGADPDLEGGKGEWQGTLGTSKTRM